MASSPQKTIPVSLETFRDQGALPALDQAQEAIHKAQKHLLSLQKPEGYWVGELIRRFNPHFRCCCLHALDR